MKKLPMTKLPMTKLRVTLHRTLAATLGIALVAALACKEEPSAPPAPPSAAAPEAAASPEGSAPEAPPPALPAPPTPPATPEIVRPAVLAGSWYPGEPAALGAAVDRFVADAGDPAEVTSTGRLIGLVVPHAGYRFSGATAGYAYRALRAARPRRVVLLGPSHRVAFRGVALPAATHFETPLGRVPLDRAALDRLARAPLFAENRAAHAREHSLEIQIPFLQRTLGADGWTLVPLVVGRLEEADVARAAAAIRPLLDEHTVLVASSDFTHYGPNYGYEPFAGGDPAALPARIEALDRGAWERAAARDLPGLFAYKGETGATICGFLPIAILVAALPEDAAATLLHHDTSGAVTGDWTNSVSYVAAAFTSAADGAADGADGAAADPAPAGANPLTAAERATLLRLARDTVEARVREGRTVDPLAGGYDITDRLREASGAFVTLKKEGRLRGCIGEILPRRPLYLVVRDHAVDAAVHDRRFHPVAPAELADLHVEVSVLTPPRRVAGWRDIEIGRHGVFLTKGVNRAVYLPQVAPEQGWDVEETLDHLARKAGLPTDGWRTGAQFDVFEAIVFGEGGADGGAAHVGRPRT